MSLLETAARQNMAAAKRWQPAQPELTREITPRHFYYIETLLLQEIREYLLCRAKESIDPEFKMLIGNFLDETRCPYRVPRKNSKISIFQNQSNLKQNSQSRF